MTWTHADGGYSLFFNRDELRTRPPEHPPKRWSTRGVAAIAPLDSGGGGAWIAVNEHGLTAALLNHYAREAKAPERPRSRGGIPLAAASHGSVVDALAWATSTTMAWFKPFHLALVDAGGREALVTWDGSRVSVAESVRLPVTTSSFRPDEVARAREAHFREMVPAGGAVSPGVLEAFHRSRSPQGGAWSVWMERTDACTRSLIRVDVDAARVAMRYEIAHPGYTVSGGSLVQQLARAGAVTAGGADGRSA